MQLESTNTVSSVKLSKKKLKNFFSRNLKTYILGKMNVFFLWGGLSVES